MRLTDIGVFRHLVLAFAFVFVAIPQFQLYQEFLSGIVHHDIHSLVVSRLWLNVVIACAVDDWFQEAKE